MTGSIPPEDSIDNALNSLSEERVAIADAIRGEPANAPVSGTAQGVPRMSRAGAEEYVTSLYANVLKREPYAEEFANWVSAAAAWPAEDVYFAFANSEEYKRRQRNLALSSEVVSAETDASIRSWTENGEFIKNTSSSEDETNPDLPRFGISISFGKGGDSEEVIGSGWSIQEDACRWMTGSVSVLALPIPAESNTADFILMLQVTPHTANGQIDGQRCTVVCGAETVAEVKIRRSSWIGFRISAKAAVSEKLAIVFVHPDAGSPREFGISPDSRELAIAVHEAVLLPVTEADELMGWRGRTGQFVSSDWRAQAIVPDWKKIAFRFQSLGQDCELGVVQRHCGAEPLGLFRFSSTWLPGLIQGLRSEFSEMTDEEQMTISIVEGEYIGVFKNLNIAYHTWIPIGPDLDVAGLRRKESARLQMLVRLFKEDLEDGEKVFVLLAKFAPLDEFEVLALISLMRRYNPKVALLWVTLARPDERHLVGQCEMVGNNLLRGYLDRFGELGNLTNTISVECWKDILVSALEALGRPIPTQVQVC